MFNFDRTAFQRTATAALGALVLTTTAVTAAVGPARAVETTPIAQLQVADEARA